MYVFFQEHFISIKTVIFDTYRTFLTNKFVTKKDGYGKRSNYPVDLY